MRVRESAISILAVVPLLAPWAFGQEIVPQGTPPYDQQDPEITIPAGTVIPISLTTFLNTRSSQPGDTFHAETVYPVWINQMLVIPRGTLVRGTVTEVVRPGRVKGKGRLAIRIDSVILANGVTRNLIASFRGIHGPGAEKLDRSHESVEMDSSKGADVGVMAGTTGQGAIIGAIADRGTGAAIGAGAGATAGLLTVLFSRGPDLVLEPGTEFDIELKQPVRFAYGEIGANTDQSYRPRRYTARPRSDRQIRPPSFSPGLRFLIPWFGPWF
jgi:type IV secretion system protein VirB10